MHTWSERFIRHIISHIDDSRLTFSDLSMVIGREAGREGDY